VAFNISPRHFLAPGFVDEITELVLQANVLPHQVVLELTERQELSDLVNAAELIERLHQCGIKVAIDDAGTGHSGLSYLQKLGAQVLKIDKLFVDAIASDFSARVIVEMLVRAARKLSIKTIAEGIEQPSQLSWLRDIGVDEGQGLLVCAALPVTDFMAFVQGRNATAFSPQQVEASAEVA
jgi:EAL domain-containing protein (putative c-di-GMP-specific phosphodiesterase class I)